jgi:polysaccharide deacetylase 2 family uncharacterized protein YibQ
LLGKAGKDGQSPPSGLSPLVFAWLLLLVAVSAMATYALLSGGPPAAQPSAMLTLQAEEEEPEDPAAEEGAGTEGEAPTEDTTEDTAGIQEEAPPESATASDEPAEAAAVAAVPPQDDTGADQEPAAEEPVESALPEPPAEAAAQDGDSTLPPWRRFAAVHDAADLRPKIAIVLTGLGLAADATERAIEELPASVTLSLTPYASRLDHWMALARGKGHEVMLDLPMEPTSFPSDDPGPQALLTQLDAAENRQRLRWVLDRGEAYVGLAAVMGSRFTKSESHLKPVLAEIKGRGLMFVDNRAAEASVVNRVAGDLGLPHVINDRMLDDGQASHVAIDARLAQTERLALSKGAAVAMGRPYPATLERLREWVRSLDDRGFVLVPVTAVAETTGY